MWRFSDSGAVYTYLADLLRPTYVQSCNQKFISGVFCFIPFLPLLSFRSFPLSFPASKWPIKSSEEIRGALIAPPAGKNEICSQMKRIGSKYTKMRLRFCCI